MPLLSTPVRPVPPSGALWRQVTFACAWLNTARGIWPTTGAVAAHILLVIEGELVTELGDGRVFTLKPGMSFQVADDDSPHRTRTEPGAKLFIVD